jgi:hypothetical protein
MDGKYLYYTTGRSIERLGPLESQSPVQASLLTLPSILAQLALHDDSLYYIAVDEAAHSAVMRQLNLPTGRVSDVVRIPRQPHMGLSVSPDGSSIVYSQLDQHGSDLVLVENFQN